DPTYSCFAYLKLPGYAFGGLMMALGVWKIALLNGGLPQDGETGYYGLQDSLCLRMVGIQAQDLSGIHNGVITLRGNEPVGLKGPLGLVEEHENLTVRWRWCEIEHNDYGKQTKDGYRVKIGTGNESDLALWRRGKESL
ncbi:MAG TPA: hypothetical protein VE844_09805, partial [Gammaproteobacteria bacterium]|nr:hypothetical protein [Gammaproteobacteria bacterium]